MPLSTILLAAVLCGPPAPDPVRSVTLSKTSGGTARLSWVTQLGYFTDVVRGSLTTLASTAGDFGIALGGCVLEDGDVSSFDDPDLPPLGEGYWYLLRADQVEGCPMGEGTYNSWNTRQVANRNLEIQGSGRDCGCWMNAGGTCPFHDPYWP